MQSGDEGGQSEGRGKQCGEGKGSEGRKGAETNQESKLGRHENRGWGHGWGAGRLYRHNRDEQKQEATSACNMTIHSRTRCYS